MRPDPLCGSLNDTLVWHNHTHNGALHKDETKKDKKKKRPKLVLWASLHDNVPTVDDKSLEHSLGKVDSLN